MPETLKKLREPAALAAVVFAGVVILVGIINLLAPPGNGGTSVPFSDRAFDQTTGFLSLEVAAAVAFGVYLANHAGPAVAKARLITLAALVEIGLAALFGVVTALAQFGANGVDGESKFLKFLEAAGGAAVVAVAGMFTLLTWQALAPATRPAGQPGGAFIGGHWPNRPGGGSGAGTPGGQQYGQPSPPPGGFGWTPQQGQATQAPGQSSPTAFGQQPGQTPGQGQGQGSGYEGPGSAFGQTSSSAQTTIGGAPQPFGSDRTQMLPPVQSGQPGQSGQPPQPPVPGAQLPFGQPPQPPQPGQSSQSPFGQPPQPGQPSQALFGQSPQPGQSSQSPFGQPPQPPQPGQPAFGQPPQPPQLGRTTLSSSGSHQLPPPPLPPTMQGYAAEPSPWSPGGPGTAGGHRGTAQHQGEQQDVPQPGQHQAPPARAEEPEDQRPGPFQIGDWRSE